MSMLIVGGTSGLGLEIAREASRSENVIVTGRHNPNIDFAQFQEFDLAADNLPARIGKFVLNLPPINSLVYAAGFYQEGHITDISDEDVDTMINVGGRGLIFFVKKLLEKQNSLNELVTITSTSQWTPRELEPVYNFVKAGAGHYSHGQSLDPRINKTLVVGTSGMNTEFWSGTDKDTSSMMDPKWVAERISSLRKRDDKYIFAKILGANADLPNRVEIVDEALTLGKIIKQQRNKLGFSQKEAAEIIGVSRQYLHSLENNKPINPNKTGKIWKPKPKTLLKIADALDIDEILLLKTAGYATIDS